MTLMARLSALLGKSAGPEQELPDREAQLTAAALLALVARIDGRLVEVEEEGLRTLLGARFGLSPDEAARLIDRAAAPDAELDPASAMAERIAHDLPAAERPELLALAYRIAAADGQVHEFEDDLLWRLGHLLGLAEERIAAIRDDALRGAGPREP